MSNVISMKDRGAVDDSLVFADQELQATLYERLTNGDMNPDRFRLLNEKLRLWQILTRELVEAVIPARK